jgi:hypothetical protein
MIELNDFNIGFEFEFLFPSKILKSLIESKKSFESVDIKNKVYHEGIDFFMKIMESQYPHTDWHDICMTRRDETIQASEFPHYSGIEIATKKQSGEEAFIILGHILSVIAKTPFKTNDTCGLHVNASFKYDMPNEKTLSFYTAKNLDLYKINKKFKREKNEHCIPNFDTKVSREEMGLLLFDCLFNNEKNDRYFTNYAKFEQKINELTNKEKLTQFLSLMKEQVIEDATVNWDNERPAIAHKRYENLGYLEFRSIGGKNYAKKIELINSTIYEFLEAMLKAKQFIYKDKTLKHRKY